jgi:protein-arginine kinase activator protein McsA
MPSTLCDLCHQQPATVFVTKIVNNHTSKHRLCAECARISAGNALEAAGEFPDVSHLPLEDIVKNLFGHDSLTLWSKSAEDVEIESDEVSEFSWTMGLGEFPGDEDAVDEIDEANESDQYDEEASIDGSMLPSAEEMFNGASSTQAFEEIAGQLRGGNGFASTRCPKCNTTWDRLRQDGRAGCAQCYSTFANQLAQVMERVQRASQHAGKAPRTAEKRHRRLLHLRARRDHRLEMLNRRLEESIAHEKYEEAARLRDKIKILTSTIVDD